MLRFQKRYGQSHQYAPGDDGSVRVPCNEERRNPKIVSEKYLTSYTPGWNHYDIYWVTFEDGSSQIEHRMRYMDRIEKSIFFEYCDRNDRKRLFLIIALFVILFETGLLVSFLT